MFTQALVQVVNITWRNVYQLTYSYQSYFTKKVNKLLKWLIMELWKCTLVKRCGNWNDVLATRRIVLMQMYVIVCVRKVRYSKTGVLFKMVCY